eukprot:CAMPEP_0198135326 /NCGR_PEP_ID=MMETSP1442-20131203/60532_1 /TAXON_ID= /ORGANISM="Craspedostauros australis, Strain CCMP3328" /LENGTH=390 /DNA_ID=CAMNT_0043796491 /DNA_START=36 /DNA_END=1208 /DNA_ORIENTATION=-
MDASLQFINELLRNMLDMHRAADKQMKITMAPTDLLRDVLEPVAAILYLRGSEMQILVECPNNLMVLTDRLRLKQIVLNLATNASKFVEQGFIRLRAAIIDGCVQVNVEDSGPGVPPEKRDRLFVKFQESLDLLNQGTGIGLCLCKHLSQLMHGDIWLDSHYHSGVTGCRGSRFVVDLKVPPLTVEQAMLQMGSDDFEEDVKISLEDGTLVNSSQSSSVAPATSTSTPSTEVGSDLTQRSICHTSPKGEDAVVAAYALPETLSVLFVDDDMILRKLFKRSIQRVAKEWQIEEASNGETALQMAQSKHFDLIFVDQYMASIEKQLLGSETARALRSRGVSAKICGLSANDAESLFLDAGANCFMFKPFPCEPVALRKELHRVLHSGSRGGD